jgi:hypothetical protein
LRLHAVRLVLGDTRAQLTFSWIRDVLRRAETGAVAGERPCPSVDHPPYPGKVVRRWVERYGRHVGTRTPDLYRVKVAL